MSRTYRRKNYEVTQNRSWNKNFRRVFGHYVKRGWSGQGSAYHFRAMTEREQIEEFWFIHSESKHHNAWTPGKWYRKRRMKQNRMINKTEIIRYFKRGDEYEPMTEADPRNCWWDWS